MISERMQGLAWGQAAGRGKELGNGLRQIVMATILVLETWAERRRQRQTLAALPAALLRDVGITAAEAQGEAMKPFWRA